MNKIINYVNSEEFKLLTKEEQNKIILSKEYILELIKSSGLPIVDSSDLKDEYEFITSRLDGKKYKQIHTGGHLRLYNITTEQYKVLFPDAGTFIKSSSDNHYTKNDDYKKNSI